MEGNKLYILCSAIKKSLGIEKKKTKKKTNTLN